MNTQGQSTLKFFKRGEGHPFKGFSHLNLNNKWWVQYPKFWFCIWITIIASAVYHASLAYNRKKKEKTEDRWFAHFSDLQVWYFSDTLHQLRSGKVSNAMYWWATEGFRDILCGVTRSSSCASAWYLTLVQLYLFMLLGICLHIMCLTPSTWNVWSAKMVKCGRDDALLPTAYSIHKSASEVNRSGADT